MSTLPIEIATIRPGLALRSLVADDGAASAELMAGNAVHLTRHGDYADMVYASAEEHGAAFTQADPLHNFGIYEFGQLVGAAEAAGGVEVEVLDAGLVTQPGRLEVAEEPALLALGHLGVNEQAEAVVEGQCLVVGALELPVDPPRFGLGYWLAALRSD